MARPGACLLFLGEVGGSCVAVSDSGKSKREKDIEEIGKEGSGRRMREEAGNGKKRKERKRLALTAVLLFICVAATADVYKRQVFHGRDVCTARTKPHCERCCLQDICGKHGVE